jgi:two-component system sensor histidine kinase KdpD
VLPGQADARVQGWAGAFSAARYPRSMSMSERRWSGGSDVVVGALASAGAVALVSAVIGVLDQWAPVLGLGSLYVFAVLPIAIGWGLAYALPVAVASMLAFNWLFLPPAHTFHLRDGENWLVLVLYLVVAVVTSELAARARRRARYAEQREREAALLAAVAASLLGGGAVTDELDGIATRAAGVLGVPHAWIGLGGDATTLPDAVASPLEVDGRRVGTLWTPAPGPADGEVVRRFLPALASLLAVAIDRELLEREALEAEALRRSDAIKTTLLRAVSHDLRSPLTAIVAAADGLGNAALQLDDDDRSALLETIRIETSRLDRMVRDLLDLSRLEAGAVDPQRELWSVDELVGAALDELQDEGGISVDMPVDVPPVEVDAAHVRRILVNLLENAHRHAGAGAHVRIAVAEGSETVVIRVADDGPGIPVSELEAVFQPFWRRGSGGVTGLGLAIARGFAGANGGTLRAEAAAGGATFVLTLPTRQIEVIRG